MTGVIITDDFMKYLRIRTTILRTRSQISSEELMDLKRRLLVQN
jgi:hypothetical protein